MWISNNFFSLTEIPKVLFFFFVLIHLLSDLWYKAKVHYLIIYIFQDYYSVAVVDGQIEARFNGGNGEATIVSEDVYNDGNYHTITVLKAHRK